MVREFSSAALQGCRDEALVKTADFMTSLPAGMGDADKFKVLSSEWEKVQSCFIACADNFDAEGFLERKNYNHTDAVLTAMMRGYVEGAFRLESLTAEMEKLGCTKVNGTSVAFGTVANKTRQIRIDLDRALTVYERGPFSIGNIDESPTPRA